MIGVGSQGRSAISASRTAHITSHHITAELVVSFSMLVIVVSFSILAVSDVSYDSVC